MTAIEQIAYRAPLISGRIELHSDEVWVSFFYLRQAIGCRYQFADLCGDRVRRLVKINPFAYLLCGSAALLSVVSLVDLQHGFSLGTVIVALIAASSLILAYRYRTITWYYVRTKDVHSAPLIFPCPPHKTAACDELLATVIQRVASASEKR